MTGQSRSTTMLMDEFLPRFDETIVEHVVIEARPEVVYRTVRDMDFLSIHSPLMDAAMLVRMAPERIGRRIRREPPPPPPPAMRLADLFEGPLDPDILGGWVPLGEEPSREMVFGAVGKVWQPQIEWKEVPPDEFAAFAEPGFAKIAAGFSMRSYGEGRTLLSYEARTAGTDEESRRRFGRYWWLVRLFVGVVLRAALRTAKDLAEPVR
jgi:hypothetical protein